MKIGILKETDSHHDKRVAVTPAYAQKIQAKFPQIEIIVQPSEKRAYANHEYTDAGIKLCNDLSICDVLLGIKKPKIETIIPHKTYLFFAHVGKEQAHQKEYFKAIASKGISLIDFEYFTNDEGKRLTAFGYMAGIAGAYHLLNMIHIRQKQVPLPPIETLKNTENIFQYLNEVKLNPSKIIISGKGNVASGAVSILNACKIVQVSANQIIHEKAEYPVFCMLPESNYIAHKNTGAYRKDDFRTNPENYTSTFHRFASIANAYIACHYWNSNHPPFLTARQLKIQNLSLKCIADISCDIGGPIASTLRETSHEEPYYDYNPMSEKEEKAFSSKNNIQVMSIGNLPSILPREASQRFSKNIFEHIIPLLADKPGHRVLKRATILKNGGLDTNFEYLRNFLNS